MKNRKIFIISLLFLSLFLTGCDHYKDGSYAEKIIISWFNYKTDDVDLGKIRRKIESIAEIEDVSCDFVTKYKKNYIYKCNLTYKEIGETLIPLGEVKTKSVYAALIPYKNKFTYKVYNSTSENKIWEKDSDLK